MIGNVPNYAMELLQKRKDLATMLISVSKELDEYCCRIGLSVDSEICLGKDIAIYTTPDIAYDTTRLAIARQLSENEQNRVQVIICFVKYGVIV